MARTVPKVPKEDQQLRYQQVYQYVLDHIETHKLQPGDRLPSATELVNLTNVSMISVRRGLTELEDNGLITRHQGVGTFVATERIVTAPNLSGELLSSLVGTKPRPEVRTELLSLVIGTASDNIAAALSMRPGEPVWEVRRVRHVGATTPILERAVLPVVRVPTLNEAYLRAGKSMYAYIEKEHGLTDATTEQAIQVDQPSQQERRVLHLKGSPPVVRIRGVSLDVDGIAFDCYEHVYNASDFIFYIASADRRELLRPRDRGDWVVDPLGTPSRDHGRVPVNCCP